MKKVKKLKKVRVEKGMWSVVVSLTPWYALIVGIYGLLIGLTTVNLSPFATSGGLQLGASVLISGVMLLIASCFFIASFFKLRKREKRGYVLFAIGQVINCLSAIILFDFFRVVGGVIILYILFRIAKYYK